MASSIPARVFSALMIHHYIDFCERRLLIVLLTPIITDVRESLLVKTKMVLCLPIQAE